MKVIVIENTAEAYEAETVTVGQAFAKLFVEAWRRVFGKEVCEVRNAQRC
jgi:hypothetical protein